MDALLQTGLSNAFMATVLAVLVAGIGRLCRRPALVHCLWLLVLVKLITPSFVVCRIPWPDGPELKTALHADVPPVLDGRVDSDQEAEAKQSEDAMADLSVAANLLSALPLLPQTGETQPTMDDSKGSASATLDWPAPAPVRGSALLLYPAMAGIWLAGSIIWFAVVAHRLYRFRRLLRWARPASPKLRAQAQRLAERLGLAACPALWLLPGRLSPMVCALAGRPRLLVPSALWERLNPEQQTTLLVHELAHLRRRDQWVRGLELLVTGLYWWHPVVWWARREIRAAEEQCCDAWVVWTLPRAARAYATALLETIDFVSETQDALPAVASGIGHVHDLRRRLTMIMHGTTPRALSGAGLLVVLGLGAFLLPLRPTWAQVEEPRARRPAQEAEEQRRDAEAARAQAEDAQQQALQAREQARHQFEAEREKFRAERQRLAQEVGRMKTQLERAMSNLKQAEERLAQLQDLEKNAARDAVRQQIEATRPQSPRGRAGRAAGREQASEPERRLTDLEKKLDELLAEVQSLRREMRRSGPGMMQGPPGMPSPAPAARPRGMRPSREVDEPRPSTPRQPRAPILTPPDTVGPTPARPAAPALAPTAPAPPAPPSVEVPAPAGSTNSSPELAPSEAASSIRD